MELFIHEVHVRTAIIILTIYHYYVCYFSNINIFKFHSINNGKKALISDKLLSDGCLCHVVTTLCARLMNICVSAVLYMDYQSHYRIDGWLKKLFIATLSHEIIVLV